MRILVIRHGESQADLLNVHEGRADFDLTAKGRAQAAAMSAWVHSRYCIDKIYTSPLRRAMHAAQFLGAAFDLQPRAEDDLMEFNNGLLAGIDRKTADEKYPYIENLPPHEAVYEQESQLEFRFRAERVLSKIISESVEDATVAIVSHGGTINQLFRALIGAPADSHLFCLTGDTGIHEWIIQGSARKIQRSNSLEHLGAISEEEIFHA